MVKQGDYNLFVPQVEAPLRVAASSSRISQLTLIDILYHVYLQEGKESSMDKIIFLNKLLKLDKFQNLKLCFKCSIFIESAPF